MWSNIHGHPASWQAKFSVKLCLRFMSSAPYKYRAWNPIASNRPDTIFNQWHTSNSHNFWKFQSRKMEGLRTVFKDWHNPFSMWRIWYDRNKYISYIYTVYSILTHWLMNIRTCLAVPPNFCKSFLKLLPLAPHPQHLSIFKESENPAKNLLSLAIS